MGTTWINLTWYHNKTCCTNSTYMLLWQQWQSEGASANMSMVDPADPHLSITQLKPGTMYMVNVSVECQGHELKNATECITTKYTGKFMCIYALECMYKIALTCMTVYILHNIVEAHCYGFI